MFLSEPTSTQINISSGVGKRGYMFVRILFLFQMTPRSKHFLTFIKFNPIFYDLILLVTKFKNS